MSEPTSLWAELKRRNVVRVAAAYAVIAWLLIEVSDTIFPRLGLPEWTVTLVIALLLLGLPLALFLAWAFELTPEGMKRTDDLTGDSPAPRTGWRRTDRLIVVALLAVIALLVGERFWPGDRPGAESPAAGEVAETPQADAPARSIAVLAFDDLSPQRDQAYFAEGISEELLNLLARIEGFKVAARTSSFKFRGANLDIGEIGRALNVETVLEGSVRKSGNQLRVTAQLINVADGFHLWSQSYDRELSNIFAVQDEIATAIVDALKLKLDLGAATAGRTRDTAAYDHYLRGRQLGRQPTQAGLLRAVEEFERAIAIDPSFAAAYAGIADAWVWLEDYGGIRSAEAFPRAEQAARRALELDPQSAEAHAAMAFVLDRYHRDKPAARDYFERTLELNPNYVNAYNLYGDTLRDLGDYPRMIEVHRKAVELDPLSYFMKTRLASKLMGAGQVEEAETIIASVFEDFPGNDFAHEEMGNLERNRGRLAEAARHFRIVHFARPGDPFAAAQLAQIGVTVNEPAMVEQWIAAARKWGADNRWELSARSRAAFWRQDWEELGRVANLVGGDNGALLRGMAAARQGSWPEARQHLLDSLRNRARLEDGRVPLSQAQALVELGWVEQQLGLADWQQALADARQPLERLPIAGGGHIQGDFNQLYFLVSLHVLSGDEAAALDVLRGMAESGFVEHWLIEQEPVFAGWRDTDAVQALLQQMRDTVAAERARLAGMEILP
ncbi:MAG TPA: tetratricopeptide repeat protein [Gammaproteobacteria bacterium]|nr:tetratricopeptide repeat protein [Gammaproteobacteria bacterium]